MIVLVEVPQSAQFVLAVLGLSQFILDFAQISQKSYEHAQIFLAVLDVHVIFQIFQNVNAQICPFWTSISLKRWLSLCWG